MPSKRSASASILRIGTLLVCCIAGLAQTSQTPAAPVVPLDHFGPPICDAAAPTATSLRLPAVQTSRSDTAIAINEAGAQDPSMLASAEPMENFDIARYRLADYADCVGAACYWADLDAQYKRAEAALKLAVAGRKPREKLAIVMDIDETSLSSYCELKREDFGYIQSMSDEWVVSPRAAIAIPGGVRLFNAARAAGVDVFFITGRPERQTEATARNLEAAGYHGWKGLALRNSEEAHMKTAVYKSRRRAQIVAQGYRILLSVGDQWSDLSGMPRAEISIKLPNPFYFLP